VVVNGAGWEHAVDALRSRPNLAVALHLNLFEGAAISPAGEVDLLVDGSGRFRRSFVGLCAEGLTRGRARRLRSQIELEMRRQIERFLDRFGDRGGLTVDAHVHYHVVPVVFDALLAVAADYSIDAIRLPREPLYWPRTPGAPRPVLSNAVKNVVLGILSRRALPALAKRSIETTAAFVGVLGSGQMTLAHVAAALGQLGRDGITGTVEILFHPGRARPGEAALWNDRPELRALYLSPDRDREAALLCSPAFARLLRDEAWREGTAFARGTEVTL
jgi:predicted glycoside hydrolase/deacetylase ChbG (UPF0249 family)